MKHKNSVKKEKEKEKEKERRRDDCVPDRFRFPRSLWFHRALHH
jgi:hypothetical protein